MEKSLFVYGAQAMAYGIARALETACGQPVAGYVVTRQEGNPASIRGKRVLAIDALGVPPEKARFLLAVPAYLHEEIRQILADRGYRDARPVDAELEYRIMSAYYRKTDAIRFVDRPARAGRDSAPVPSDPAHSGHRAGEPPAATGQGGELEIYVAKSALDKPLAGSFPASGDFHAVQAGAALHPPIGAEFRDDEGESISSRNGHYDELTVTYWAWKNRHPACKGIAHYRRYLAPTQEERAALLLGRADAILPLPFLCYPDTRMQYGRYNRPEAVAAMLEAVGAVYGNGDKASADAVLRGEYLYNYNMLLARAEAFDSYAAWIFPVLGQVERLCPELLPPGEHTRVCGHLGELLLSIYFLGIRPGWRTIHAKRVWIV